ncbi:hypothetical protein HG531_011009 [Fusarium graminearum]|nr:hypothetical protein HG531_011009 [Fusarium graminearum]
MVTPPKPSALCIPPQQYSGSSSTVLYLRYLPGILRTCSVFGTLNNKSGSSSANSQGKVNASPRSGLIRMFGTSFQYAPARSAAEIKTARGVSTQIDCENRLVQQGTEFVEQRGCWRFHVARERFGKAHDASDSGFALEACGNDLRRLNRRILEFKTPETNSIKVDNTIGMGTVN